MSKDFNKTEKKIISFLLDNPYSDRKVIIEGLEGYEGVGEALDILSKDFILIELTGPMESSLESRVPKKVYMVNPEKESELEGI